MLVNEMVRGKDFEVCCDWFEGTCFPKMPVDDFVWDFCDQIFGAEPKDIAEYSTRGWQGYSGRVVIGGKDKLVSIYFRKEHCFSRCPENLAGDMRYPIVTLDGYGELHNAEFRDIHIVVTGSGLRFLGHDRSMKLLLFFKDQNFTPADGFLPRFAYGFTPTRIDIALDFYNADNEVVPIVSDALLSEYNHACDLEYKGEVRCSCPAKVRTLVGYMQSGSTNWTWGARGTSNFYFRFYDKKIEQESKNGPLAGKYEYWWRLEYECRMCAALNIGQFLIYDGSVDDALHYCLDCFLTVVEDQYDDQNKSHNPVVEMWSDLVDFFNVIDRDAYKRKSIVVQPYTIIHLVQSKQVRCNQDIFLAYVADPDAFKDECSLQLLNKIRSDPRYRSAVLALDRGILNIDEYHLIRSLPASRGVSDCWEIEF